MDVVSEDKRFYIIVPETLQTMAVSREMEPGRLIAQGFHIGRVVERIRAEIKQQYEDVTAIVLSVRNSLELVKVLSELEVLREKVSGTAWIKRFPISLYQDHNPDVYQTPDRVLTALCVGPVEKSLVHPALGHLELY